MVGMPLAINKEVAIPGAGLNREDGRVGCSTMSAGILIVDDDEVLGRVLRRVCSGYGYPTHHATGAEEALRLAREHPPRLALIDLCLPGTDGIALARRLREEVPDTTFVLMTAYPLRLNEGRAVPDDFAALLSKPLDLATLREVIREALGGAAVRCGATKFS
jgi:CheY-like chemotaxis protein